MRHRQRILGLVAACLPLLAAAQGRGPVDRRSLPDVSPTFKGTLVLPVPLRNPLFSDIVEVLGQLDGVVQLPLWEGLGIGAGAKMTWFTVKERALAPILTSGDIRRSTFFGKVQYERYTGPRTFYEFSARAGASTYVFDCPTCPEDNRRTVFHWAMGVGYYVHATENLSFGLHLGYETDATRFSAGDLGLPGFPGRRETGDAADFQNFVIGLGFSTRFRRSDDGVPPGW